MTEEESLASTVRLRRLRVVAEADPQVISRVLERFANLNVLPRRVLAERGIADLVHIQVDLLTVTDERLSLIAAKLGELPTILSAQWHDD